MRFRSMQMILGTALLAAGSIAAVHAKDAGKTDCEMRFNLTGWSAIYKHAEGSGMISCDNGMSYPVTITAVGGGLTVGKYKVEGGKAKFSDVATPTELFGDYAQGEANAAIVKGGTAQVLTKGDVSMALSGSGPGVDIGISFGKFTIAQAAAPRNH